MNVMSYVGVSTIPKTAYCDLDAGEGTKLSTIWRLPTFSNVLLDTGFLFSSGEAKAAIEIFEKPQIWEVPAVREMLGQPFGAPVKLTREQAIEIVKGSFGSRPDLPEGRDYVRDVRLAFGESIFSETSGGDG